MQHEHAARTCSINMYMYVHGHGHLQTCAHFLHEIDQKKIFIKIKFYHHMKLGGGGGSRRITMSVTAAISPDESNWGGSGVGGVLRLLVDLFAIGRLEVMYTLWQHENIILSGCQD
jgi:hypothetical protein